MALLRSASTAFPTCTRRGVERRQGHESQPLRAAADPEPARTRPPDSRTRAQGRDGAAGLWTMWRALWPGSGRARADADGGRDLPTVRRHPATTRCGGAQQRRRHGRRRPRRGGRKRRSVGRMTASQQPAASAGRDGRPHADGDAAPALRPPPSPRAEPRMCQPAAEVLVYERILPAVPPTVGRIRGELDLALACLDVAVGRREEIALVVTEAATNAVLHAYLDTTVGPLYVIASVSARSLFVTVCDWGRGMTPHRHSPGLGLGVALMRALADAVDITPNDSGRGTRVAVLFRDATPPIGAPEVSRPVQATMTAYDDADALRAYVSALAKTTAALRDDAKALHAQARHAVARARRL